VALADPGYPAYRNILTALGIEPVSVVADYDTRFQPTPALLDRVAGPIHGLIVASPANPTGSMMAPEELAAVARWCREHSVRLISDEIYHGITYGMRAATALAFTDEAIVINSFSKYFSMTGWRLGWMIVPPDLLRAVEVLAQNLFISPPSLPQLAAIAAFDAREELDRNVARYRANRDLLLRALPEAGFTRFAPADGAFYLYTDVAHMTNDSEAFCKRMLAETGVAATPGTDFDPGRGSTFVRFSYAGTTEDMLEAARRLKAWRR
jgi:aspartate/methionine/tyrosine aminotransferase